MTVSSRVMPLRRVRNSIKISGKKMEGKEVSLVFGCGVEEDFNCNREWNGQVNVRLEQGMGSNAPLIQTIHQLWKPSRHVSCPSDEYRIPLRYLVRGGKEGGSSCSFGNGANEDFNCCHRGWNDDDRSMFG
ncbi:hypothetical protein CEXT_269641 [Caerostris extrusa]|uniref:Uncharacterized protein n=1 Tax=Caerostris extrusa TaxID=172846 RepID=A0AAV4XMD4_CAEEX|nr:hypothetical protein CEXT_269641 [Caerostris extrusa]